MINLDRYQMSIAKSSEAKTPSLNLSKAGSWKNIIELSEKIESLLQTIESNQLEGNITKSELKTLYKKWKNWRPHNSDDFSVEMREKTAEQSCTKEASLEKEQKEPEKEAREAGNSLLKATKQAEKQGLEEAKKHLKDAAKSAGLAIGTTIQQGVQSVEEKIYEKVILKANSLYFDHSALNAILSKNIGADPSKKYQLTIHSNQPHLRKFFAERIDWDDC